MKRRYNRPLRAVSLFSGGGGMDLGMSAVGIKIAIATDSDEHSCKTLRTNSGKRRFYTEHPVLCADIRELTGESLLKEAKLGRGDIDLVVGGPPCQAFSVFGKRGGLSDPRGNLVWEFLRIVKEIQPPAFVFENVEGLRTIHDGKLYSELYKLLSCGGKYAVSDHVYEMASHGIPQHRRRVIFVGSRVSKSIPPMEATHGPDEGLFGHLRMNTVKQALSNMPGPGIDSSLPNHIGRDHSDRIVKRYQELTWGERDPRTRINKLHPGRPSFTIIVGSDAGGGKGHVHPNEPREVTPRESARIQTFPDWWEFSGTGRHVIRQVGNAVPPLFAALLGEHIKRHIFGIGKRRSFEHLLETIELPFLLSPE